MADIEALFREHYGLVYRFLLSLCRDAHLAEELTQETFFRAYINARQLRDDTKALSWLCSIARNELMKHYRKQRRLVPLEEVADGQTAEDVAQTVEIKVLADEVYACAKRLEEPYQTVFLLAVCGDVSTVRISRVFGKSESWARVTLSRAKCKIKEMLEENV